MPSTGRGQARQNRLGPGALFFFFFFYRWEFMHEDPEMLARGGGFGGPARRRVVAASWCPGGGGPGPAHGRTPMGSATVRRLCLRFLHQNGGGRRTEPAAQVAPLQAASNRRGRRTTGIDKQPTRSRVTTTRSCSTPVIYAGYNRTGTAWVILTKPVQQRDFGWNKNTASP